MLRFISIVLFSIVAWSNTASARALTNHTPSPKTHFGDAHAGIALALKSGRGFARCGARHCKEYARMILFATRHALRGRPVSLHTGHAASETGRRSDDRSILLTATLESRLMHRRLRTKTRCTQLCRSRRLDSQPIIEPHAKARRRIASCDVLRIAGQRFERHTRSRRNAGSNVGNLEDLGQLWKSFLSSTQVDN
jgi:hypothetical protein